MKMGNPQTFSQKQGINLSPDGIEPQTINLMFSGSETTRNSAVQINVGEKQSLFQSSKTANRTSTANMNTCSYEKRKLSLNEATNIGTLQSNGSRQPLNSVSSNRPFCFD